MKKIFITLLLPLFFACSKEKAEYVDISQIAQVSAHNRTLHADIFCKYPIQIEKMDSVLIIMDLMPTDYFFHIFSLEGKEIKSFGKKGNGPGELASANQFFKDISSGKISVYSNGQLVYYDIPSILNEEKEYFEIVSLQLPDYPIANVIPLKDDYFYLGFTEDMRFITEKKGEKDIEIYNSYPSELLRTEPKSVQAAVMSYGHKVYFSPDKTRFVQPTYIGALLETFSLSTSLKFSSLAVLPIIPPEYKDMGNNSVAWDQNSIIGFDNISTSDSCLYTLLSAAKGEDLMRGEGEVFAKNITVFDWNTKPLYKIMVNEMLMCLTVDEENKRCYAIAYSDEGYSLICTTWNDI